MLTDTLRTLFRLLCSPLMQAQHVQTDPSKPKTLAQAREIILNLRAKLGMTPIGVRNDGAGTAPIKKGDVIPPSPAGGTPPGSSGPDPIPSTALGLMVPTALTAFLATQTDRQLKQLLATETGRPRNEKNNNVVGRIYAELKSRGKHAK